MNKTTIRADEVYLARCPVCRRRRWAWVPIPAKKLIMHSHRLPGEPDSECGGSSEEVGTNHDPRISRARRRPQLRNLDIRRRYTPFDLGERPDHPDWMDKSLEKLQEEVRAAARKRS